MAFNGYKNFETWKFMLYFEEYLCEYLQEQQEQKLNYQDIYKTVKYFINEMYNGADENNIGSAFLNDVIGDFLVEIDIKEVAEHLERDLKED